MDSIRHEQRYSKYLHSHTKRYFDIVVCFLFCLPTLVVLTVASLIILIREGRPILFIQRRAGIKGKLFRMPKLRTLCVDANPYRPAPRPCYDPQVTITGRFLRKHRLDELPQLFSVLTGHMSLVGPRPELPNVIATYKPLHKKRFIAKPGITGLWQIMGNRNVAIHKDIKYDLYYLHKASLWFDVKILFMTVLFVLNPKRKQSHYENRIYTYNISLPD